MLSKSIDMHEDKMVLSVDYEIFRTGKKKMGIPDI